MSLIRLHPQDAQSIPSHPTLSKLQDASKCPATNDFVTKALNEASSFVKDDIPAFEKPTKKSKGSNAQVAIKTWSRGTNADYWVARHSKHAGKAETGDASWSEFELGLKENHSLNEMAYTPGVTDAVEVCKWTVGEIGAIEGWTEPNMAGKNRVTL
jgi:hypothetical protein